MILASTPTSGVCAMQRQQRRRQVPHARQMRTRVSICEGGGASGAGTTARVPVAHRRWLSSRGSLSLSSLSASSSTAHVSRFRGCAAASSSGSGGKSGGGKWRSLCRRIEAEILRCYPSERQVLRRIARCVGENPTTTWVTAGVMAGTAGAIAYAIASNASAAFLGISLQTSLHTAFLYRFPAWALTCTLPLH
jgi:hypothetical protein